MASNLADTYSGKKWWLLKHGRLIRILGFFLIILLPLVFVSLAIWIPFPFGFIGLFISMMLLCVSFMAIIGMIYSGSAYSNLYEVTKELDPGWVIEDFDPLRYKITIREGATHYVILYHARMTPYTYWVEKGALFFKNWDISPEHYQVWTTYGRGSPRVQRNRYDLTKYVRPSGILGFFFSGLISSSQRDTIFDENLMETISYLHDKAKQIPSLRFVGLAEEGVETIIVAFLTKNRGKDVIQALDLLKKITQETERFHPFGDEWD